MSVIPIFKKSALATECDQCGVKFDLMHGGVCERCQRILCMRHLHGSWLRRLRVDLGGAQLCVDCRAGRAPKAPIPPSRPAAPRSG
jgi:hypothetical protein